MSLREYIKTHIKEVRRGLRHARINGFSTKLLETELMALTNQLLFLAD